MDIDTDKIDPGSGSGTGEAVLAYMAAGEDVPQPSRSGGPHVAPAAALALKLAVYEAFRAANISKQELARRMGKDGREARRILHPDRTSKVEAMEAAVRALGRSAANISKQELARRMGKDGREARCILHPDHTSKVEAMEAAVRALGRSIEITVRAA